ncbi:hypothetical protein BV508_23775, partial [Mycobacterium intermedium]
MGVDLALVDAATTDLAHIGAALTQANSAAAPSTTGLLAAGADEVSTAIAALFGSHAQAYQALSAEAEAFHAQFVQLVKSGATSYATAEAGNAGSLQMVEQQLLGAVNAPTNALLGRPLIGDGAAGTAANPDGQRVRVGGQLQQRGDLGGPGQLGVDHPIPFTVADQ